MRFTARQGVISVSRGDGIAKSTTVSAGPTVQPHTAKAPVGRLCVRAKQASGANCQLESNPPAENSAPIPFEILRLASRTRPLRAGRGPDRWLHAGGAGAAAGRRERVGRISYPGEPLLLSPASSHFA